MITGDLVNMKIDGEVLESTLGVVTGSLGDNNYKILWLDDANYGMSEMYKASSLRLMDDVKYEEVFDEYW